MSVFVDTSALLALMDRAADDHPACDQAFRSLTLTESLVTHRYVVVETIALVQRRLGMDAVRDLDQRLLAVVRADPVGDDLHRRALDGLLSRGRRSRSFIDIVSFEYMRAVGIVRAFTVDAGFRTEGFEVVPG